MTDFYGIVQVRDQDTLDVLAPVRLLKDPLAHFLGIGCLLFLGFSWFGPSEPSEDLIRVNHEVLVPYLLHRNPGPGVAGASEYLERLPDEQKAQLVEAFVREEVLFREAKAFGLDRDDYVARRRLVTQIEYLHQLAADVTAPSAPALLAAYAEKAERYREPATITFTHAFFPHGDVDEQALLATARLARDTLNANDVPFHEGPSVGQRFVYHRNYVNKNADEIRSHFGAAFRDVVFAPGVPPELDTWVGPYLSEHGAHVLMITRVTPARTPPFEEVRQRVEADLQAQYRAEAVTDQYERARKRYRVVVELANP